MQVWMGQYLAFTGSVSEPLLHVSLGEQGINGREHPGRQRGGTKGMEYPDAQSSSSVLPVSSWTAHHCHKLLHSASWANSLEGGPHWLASGQTHQARWAKGACPAAATHGETQVYGPQTIGSAFLMGTADEVETTSALYEKLDQSRLGRWAVLYKLEWLFAPALPPGTHLPLPNRPAPEGMQAQACKLILHLNDYRLFTFSPIAADEEKQVQKPSSVCLRVAEQLG